MTSNYSNGTILTTGDTVTITVNFDTEGEADISLLSVSVLFNDQIFAWDQSASSSPAYALYVSGGKGNQYLVPATTNLTLRTGTSNQILMDWQNTALPGGNRDPGSFDMAVLQFSVIDTDGVAAFTLSDTSPGNILQLADGSNPDNTLSGDFDAATPSGCAPGKAIRDFNCDGKSDMLLAGQTSAGNTIFRTVIMDGTTNTAQAWTFMTFVTEEAIGTIQADSDSNANIVTRQTGGATEGYLLVRSLSEDGLATDPGSARYIYPGGLNWEYIGRGDIDGNGVEDLLLTKTDAPNQGLVRAVLFGDGSEGWSGDFTFSHPGFLPDSCTVRGVSDINADGLADIACERADGIIFALLMEADAGVASNGAPAPLIEFPYSYLAYTAQIRANGTGLLDPFYENVFNYYTVEAVTPFDDANDAADVAIVRTLAGPSGGHLGLIGILLNDGIPENGVFIQNSAVPNYTFLQNPGYELAPLGNFDGINRTDIASRNMDPATANPGLVFNVLQDSSGIARLTSGFSLLYPLSAELID